MTYNPKDKPSTIAIIALCLSIVTAIFSGFQWWNGQRESRIAAAVDISKNFVRSQDPKIPESLFALTSGKDLNSERLTVVFRAIGEAEYLAYLTNRDRVDFEYLSQAVKCHMYGAAMLTPKFRSVATFVVELTELPKIAPRLAGLCDADFKLFMKQTGATN